jgi:hypothetical protein
MLDLYITSNILDLQNNFENTIYQINGTRIIPLRLHSFTNVLMLNIQCQGKEKI